MLLLSIRPTFNVQANKAGRREVGGRGWAIRKKIECNPKEDVVGT